MVRNKRGWMSRVMIGNFLHISSKDRAKRLPVSDGAAKLGHRINPQQNGSIVLSRDQPLIFEEGVQSEPHYGTETVLLEPEDGAVCGQIAPLECEIQT